jgi:hypothetical protein
LACMRDDSSASGVRRAGGSPLRRQGCYIGAPWAGHGIRSSAHAASNNNNNNNI